MNEIMVSQNSVCKLLLNLNPKKAAGPDCVPCHLLQVVAKEIASAILFNSSFATGQFCQQWKHTLVPNGVLDSEVTQVIC